MKLHTRQLMNLCRRGYRLAVYSDFPAWFSALVMNVPKVGIYIDGKQVAPVKGNLVAKTPAPKTPAAKPKGKASPDPKAKGKARGV